MYKAIFQSRKSEAEKFQDWVTSEVLPSIRKHGLYAKEELLDNPDFLMDIIKKLKFEKEKAKALKADNARKNQVICELKHKSGYADLILKSKSLVGINQIAKDYGMSGLAMNKLLSKISVQYKQNGQWLLYSKFHDKGYTHSETFFIPRSNGLQEVKMLTKWTQQGRLFLYSELKKQGILPIIEVIGG